VRRKGWGVNWFLLHLTISAPTNSLFISGCGPWAMGG